MVTQLTVTVWVGAMAMVWAWATDITGKQQQYSQIPTTQQLSNASPP